MAGKQQGQGRDGHAHDGDRSPGRHAGGERAAVAAVLGGPPLAEPGGQRGPARSPAVDRRRGHAQGREQQQPGQQRPAQLVGLGQRASDAGEAEQRQRGLGPVGPQGLPPLGRSLVFGVRRNAAFLANRPSTEARATTSEVDCQMKNAPIASRHDAPVPRRTSATARIRPSSTSTGTWRPGTR